MIEAAVLGIFDGIFWILGSDHPHVPIQHGAERFTRISDITGRGKKQRSWLIIFPKLCNVKNYA